MPSKIEIMVELERRGKLPDNKRALFDEAKRRGLIGGSGEEPAAESPIPMGVSHTVGQAASPEHISRLELGQVPSLEIPSSITRPVLEATGAAAGAVAGAPVGLPGVITGSGLGYAGGKKIADISEELRGEKVTPPIKEQLTEMPKDVATGMTMEMGGQVTGKVIGATANAIGKVAKQVLGASTGAGPGMTEEALKGSKSFQDAMRGKVNGQEVVDNAKEALQAVKLKRALAYQEKLKPIVARQGDLDVTSISSTIDDLAEKYRIKIRHTPKGIKFDTSRIAMGKAGRDDIQDILQKLEAWGTQEDDMTAMGLDALRRQLDDFYSQSSQARGFVATLRKSVNDTIKSNVPEYGEMTAEYAKATELIKDIESNLMLRPEGMSGRITADQTLRRLSSAMRENFELRRDLVNALGREGAQDISGQVAGYTASQAIPRGLIGKAVGSYAGYATFMNPKMLPLLAASSPRTVGEFLVLYGKGLEEMKSFSPALYKAAGYGIGKATESNDKPPSAKSESAVDIQDAPSDATLRKAGQVYNTPKGPLRWTGTGWLPIEKN